MSLNDLLIDKHILIVAEHLRVNTFLQCLFKTFGFLQSAPGTGEGGQLANGLLLLNFFQQLLP